MAHFAQLDENNKVIQVLVIADSDTSDTNGKEVESIGVAFCQKLFGADTQWLQTSFNSNFRHKFAGIGDTYDETLDKFIPQQPFSKWVLHKDLYWEAPITQPEIDEKLETLDWNDELGIWVIETIE
jgi:hypothetical protein